jgi:hypothetical protein
MWYYLCTINRFLTTSRPLDCGEETVAFQRTPPNLIQSMAACSIAYYILYIKGRHNGNITIGGEGKYPRFFPLKTLHSR